MTASVLIICTGFDMRRSREQHASTTIDTIVVRADGSFDSAKTRKGPAPWSALPGAKLVADGEVTDAPMEVSRPVKGSRDDWGDNPKWRFECPRCGRDTPVNVDHMRGLIAVALQIGGHPIDISKLPS